MRQLRFWVSHPSVGVRLDGDDFFSFSPLFPHCLLDPLTTTCLVQICYALLIPDNLRKCSGVLCEVFFPFLLTEVNKIVRKEQVKWSNVKTSEDRNSRPIRTNLWRVVKSRMHLQILISLPCTPRAVYCAHQCVGLRGSTSGDSCSFRSCEPKPLFGNRPACLLLHLLRPWESSHSG